MRVLILGGTVLVGRHIAEAALAQGHEITLFNRGRTNPHLFPETEKLTGNRDNRIAPGLSSLHGRRWDAAIDVNGYIPRHVRDSAALLAGAVDHYIYVSTGAVYRKPFPTNGDESVPVETVDDPTTEDTNSHYGALKALCEQAAETPMPGRTLSLRLGLVSGPYDNTDRVTYWVDRVGRGGRVASGGRSATGSAVLVPAAPDAHFQTIDARDFAAFVVHALEEKITGVLNTTGPITTWRTWLETCRSITGSDAAFTWIDDWDFLNANRPADARPYGAYAMRLPPDWGDWWANNSDRAQSLGLSYRPLEATIEAILAWIQNRPADWTWQAGLSPSQEQRLLEMWMGN